MPKHWTAGNEPMDVDVLRRGDRFRLSADLLSIPDDIHDNHVWVRREMDYDLRNPKPHADPTIEYVVLSAHTFTEAEHETQWMGKTQPDFYAVWHVYATPVGSEWDGPFVGLEQAMLTGAEGRGLLHDDSFTRTDGRSRPPRRLTTPEDREWEGSGIDVGAVVEAIASGEPIGIAMRRVGMNQKDRDEAMALAGHLLDRFHSLRDALEAVEAEPYDRPNAVHLTLLRVMGMYPRDGVRPIFDGDDWLDELIAEATIELQHVAHTSASMRRMFANARLPEGPLARYETDMNTRSYVISR